MDKKAECNKTDTDNDPERNEVINKLSEQMLQTMRQPVQEALQAALKMNPNITDELLSYNLDENACAKLRESVRKLMHSSIRIGVTDKNASIPFQNYLDDDLKREIDSGSMNLVQFCNSDYACRFPPSDIMKDENVSQLFVGGPYIKPMAPRKLNAQYHRANYKNLRGPLAQGVNFDVFVNMLSSPTHIPPTSDAAEGTVRFSLSSSIMTAINVAFAPKKPTIDGYLYFECPQNSLGNPQSRFNYCGGGWKVAKRFCEACNVAVSAFYGSPPLNTPAHNEMQQFLFTETDCAVALGAISRIFQKHPETSNRLASIFYGNPTPPRNHVSSDILRLQQPIATVAAVEEEDSAAEIQTRLAIIDSLKQHQDSDTQDGICEDNVVSPEIVKEEEEKKKETDAANLENCVNNHDIIYSDKAHYIFNLEQYPEKNREKFSRAKQVPYGKVETKVIVTSVHNGKGYNSKYHNGKGFNKGKSGKGKIIKSVHGPSSGAWRVGRVKHRENNNSTTFATAEV